MRQSIIKRCLPAVLLLLPGCAATGAVLGDNVDGIQASIGQAQTATNAAFDQANADGRDDLIAYLVATNTGPSEAAFNPVIDTATAAKWNTAFAAIEQYLAALKQLGGNGPSTQIGTDLKGIGDQLQGPSFGVKLPDGAADTFAQLGGALVQAAAEGQAQAVMRRADPAFSALMTKMAALIGRPGGEVPDPGTLRRMVYDHWYLKLSDIERRYAAVRTGSPEQRQSLLVEYGAAIDARGAQYAKLVQLSDAMLAIAQAHSAAARNDASASLFWLNQIDQALRPLRRSK